jgi:5-methylcytosine-specific restriction enzyme subunit McrC
MPPRLIRLTERVPRVVHLRRTDADFLLAHHRGHVEVVPSGRAGRYRLTALGFAGVIAAPSCRLALRPKLPTANLAHLLDPLAPPPASIEAAAPVAAERLLDLLAGRMATLLTERLARGLHRDYAERAEAATYLRGRLDVAAQARHSGPRRDRLHSRYDEFTADTPCNQLPRAVVDALLARPDLDARVRAALRELLSGFAGVSARALSPDLCAAADPGPRAEGYGALLDLCRLLADGLALGEDAGAAVGPSFLIDLECVFEGYVTAGAVADFAGRRRDRVAVQPFLRASPPQQGRPDLHVRPDVLLERDGRPRLVLDAKWKRLSRTALPTDDVYQVVAYAAALAVTRAVLVYPGGRDRRWVYPLVGPGPILEIWTLRVTGPAEACEQSRRRLGRYLRRAMNEQR